MRAGESQKENWKRTRMSPRSSCFHTSESQKENWKITTVSVIEAMTSPNLKKRIERHSAKPWTTTRQFQESQKENWKTVYHALNRLAANGLGISKRELKVIIDQLQVQETLGILSESQKENWKYHAGSAPRGVCLRESQKENWKILPRGSQAASAHPPNLKKRIERHHPAPDILPEECCRNLKKRIESYTPSASHWGRLACRISKRELKVLCMRRPRKWWPHANLKKRIERPFQWH